MRKIVLYIILLVIFSILFSSCSDTNSPAILPEQGTMTYFDSNVYDIDRNNEKILEKSKYYKISCVDDVYYYYIYDDNGRVVRSDGPLNKQPNIVLLNDHLVKFTLQAGTGIGTQWGFYYDIKKDVLSRNFICIYDQTDDTIVYGDEQNIVVRNIFDKTIYYQEISLFDKPLAKVAEPITNVEFVNSGRALKVSYLTDINYKEAEEVINLPNM